MNEKIKQTIQSISELSFSARVIADRLGVATSSSGTVKTALAKDTPSANDVKALKDQIEQLNRQIEELKHQLDDEADDAVFTDDQAFDFTESLNKTLQEMPQAIISSVYSLAYLKPYPRNIRYLICLTLVNNFTSRNLKPLDLWYGVVANNGSIS